MRHWGLSSCQYCTCGGCKIDPFFSCVLSLLVETKGKSSDTVLLNTERDATGELCFLYWSEGWNRHTPRKILKQLYSLEDERETTEAARPELVKRAQVSSRFWQCGANSGGKPRPRAWGTMPRGMIVLSLSIADIDYWDSGWMNLTMSTLQVRK